MGNTEESRGYYYADEFDYDIVDIDAPHNPEKYVELINLAVENGYDILIIDSSLTENIENNINYNSYNINELILSKEISHYNFHPNKDPFNYNFTLVKRISKSANAGYWNVWIYDKNIL